MVQLIRNGGFEAGFESWSRSTNLETRIRITNSGAHGGSHALNFRWADRPGSPVWVEQTFDPPERVRDFSTGRPRLTFWHKADRGFPLLHVVVFYEVEDEFGGPTPIQWPVTPTTEWRQEVVPIDSSRRVRAIRFLPKSPVSTYIDDVSMVRMEPRARYFHPLMAEHIDLLPSDVEGHLIGIEYKLQQIIIGLGELRSPREGNAEEIAPPPSKGTRKQA